MLGWDQIAIVLTRRLHQNLQHCLILEQFPQAIAEGLPRLGCDYVVLCSISSPMRISVSETNPENFRMRKSGKPKKL